MAFSQIRTTAIEIIHKFCTMKGRQQKKHIYQVNKCYRYYFMAKQYFYLFGRYLNRGAQADMHFPIYTMDNKYPYYSTYYVPQCMLW